MTHLRLVEISSLNHSQHWFAAVLLMLAEESPANNITLQEMRDPRTLSVKGMSLTHIHQIVSEWGGREALEGLTTTQVCDRFLKPMTLGSGLSLCAQLFVSAADHAEQAKFVSKTTVTTVARKTVVCGHRSVTATTTTVKTTLAPLTRKDGTYSVRDATWFISHAWQFKFLDVLDALDHFCERQTLAPSAAILWIDLFSNSQHDTHLKEFLWWQETFIHAIKKIGNVALILQPWHDPLPLTRCCNDKAAVNLIHGSSQRRTNALF
ncbi:hypothetical protein BC830DRAFT_1165361 [Chytriomyces sp. MP71]|nr:hypothetical protein BC830DRAFT_1165361 [Chytriomyces sp. MP71]